jgi:ABC-2 type transport system ATP-binding protein
MRIELTDVRRSFGRVAALQGITAAVPSGARVALIGPNGSGKSTLLRILLGMVACEGEVRIDGLSPFAERARLAERLAYVPQVAPRIAVPVRELVQAIARVRRLDAARIAAAAAALHLDLDAVAARQLRDCSGGMRQKLLIALALATDASLFVLDEPTASLDAEGRQDFFRLINAIPAAATVVLCSHRLDELRQLTSHVWALRDGRLDFSGATDDYLQAAAVSVVDVRLVPDATGAALRARGFEPGANRWWRRVLPQRQKLAVVRDLAVSLNGSVENVLVRDLETLTPNQAPPAELRDEP